MTVSIQHHIIVLFALSIALVNQEINAQNNGVFNGGVGIGWTQGFHNAQNNNPIFQGGKDDGISVSVHTEQSQSPIFAGGSNEGYSISRFEADDHNPIYAGGSDDGVDYKHLQQQSHNSIFFGGSDDGEDHNEQSQQSDNLIFAGGKQDGYSQSRISKLIWTGAMSQDWLMAGNWNVARVPDVGDHVVIPSRLSKYPALEGKMLINQQGGFLYTCRSIDVLKQAEITGTNATWIMNYGQFNIFGSVVIIGNLGHPSQNLEGGNIFVGGSGLFHLGN
jgi:hypothetical protein